MGLASRPTWPSGRQLGPALVNEACCRSESAHHTTCHLAASHNICPSQRCNSVGPGSPQSPFPYLAPQLLPCAGSGPRSLKWDLPFLLPGSRSLRQRRRYKFKTWGGRKRTCASPRQHHSSWLLLGPQALWPSSNQVQRASPATTHNTAQDKVLWV